MILDHAMLVLSHQRCIRTLKRSSFNLEVRQMSLSDYFQKLTGHICRQEIFEFPASHGMRPDGHGKDNEMKSTLRQRHMINRRRFLGTLAALSAVLFPGGRMAAAGPGSTQTVVLCRCFIAGFQFHRGPAVLPELAVGQQLALKREPHNPFDSLAIAVHTPSGSRIGYLPRQLNDIPSFLMDSEHLLEAVIAGVAPNASPWEAVEVEIRFG
jgi:hypothetical protein